MVVQSVFQTQLAIFVLSLMPLSRFLIGFLQMLVCAFTTCMMCDEYTLYSSSVQPTAASYDLYTQSLITAT